MFLFTMFVGTATIVAPSTLETKVVSAAMFKNGYSVVVREAPVAAAGRYRIAMPGQSALGTLWFSPSEGLRLDQVVTGRDTIREPKPIESFAEILGLNVGNHVSLMVFDASPQPHTLHGKVLSVSGELTLLEQEAGSVSALLTRDIRMVLGLQNRTFTSQRTTERRFVDFTVSGQPMGVGSLRMISLDFGLTWVPGYRVDITDPKNVVVTMHTTVMNDLTDLSGIEARFVTGFPNLPFRSAQDPLTSQMSVQQFIQMLGGLGLDNELRRGRASELMMNQPPGGPEGAFEAGMGPIPLPPEHIEDLFFYRLGNFSLPRTERAWLPLLRFEAPYREVYTWDVASIRYNQAGARGTSFPAPQQVWHALLFRNNANQPLTTGAATIQKAGQLIGQDMLRYASAGSDVEVRVTQALDIRAEAQEEEVSRVRALLQREGRPVLDQVTVRGTLVLHNRKPERVEARVRQSFEGELATVEGSPKSTKSPAGLHATNPVTRLEWEVSVDPGAKRTLTYTYTFLVPGL